MNRISKNLSAECECGYRIEISIHKEILLERYGFRKINGNWYCGFCLAAGHHLSKGDQNNEEKRIDS